MSSAVATVEEKANPGPVKSSRLRKLLLIGAPILLLALGAALWFSGLIQHRNAGLAKSQSSKPLDVPTLVDVPDIVTNLDGGTRRAVFVKLKSRIEVASAADGALVSGHMPQIIDIFQTYLRSTRPEELRGGEGTYRLRESLMSRIDVVAAPAQVLDVLFIEMIVQ